MKRSKQNGITLIALIVTIIVLLILSGVTIATLTGENGILTSTMKAKEETEKSSDIEQINLLITENQIKEHIIGEKLKELEFNTVEDIKSIYDSETGKTYGNGWYYLTPENSKEEMQLSRAYIVNYETGEIVEYQDEKHRILENDLKCIKEGLVYAADPKNMTNGNTWGDAILHNFKEGDINSGWSENALMFDGIDDGIEVEDKSDYSNGVTLEIYFSFRGKVEGQLVQILMMKRKKVDNGFFMFIGNDEGFPYGILYVDIGGEPERFNTKVRIKENTPTYVTYTFNPDLDNSKGTLYINGTKIATTNLGNIDKVLEIQEDTNIQIGSDVHETLSGGDNRYPLNGEIYAARIYNRALTEQEVEYNYKATLTK